MKRRVLALVAVPFLMTSCFGGDPVMDNKPTPDNTLPTVEDALGTGGSGLTGTSDIIAAEIEARKNLQALEEELKKAQKMLEQAKSADLAKNQDGVKKTLEEVSAIATALAENDDFFLASEDLKEEVSSLENVLESFVTIDGLSAHVDLSAFEGVTIKGIARQGTDIYAIGSDGIYGPIQSGKKEDVKKIALPEGVSAHRAAYAVKFGSLHVSATPASVYALGNGSFLAQKIDGNGTWSPASRFAAYGSNLYMWDVLENKFLKYTNVGNGTYGTPEEALPGSVFKDDVLTGVAIDGSIYINTLKGGIKKFVRGEEISLSIDRPFKSESLNADLYTDLNSNYLYAFDPDNKTLLRYRKAYESLTVDKEWTLDKDYTGFFPSSNDRDVYLTDGSQIYKLSL